MGRPSEFTQEVADAICEAIADGKSLRKICDGEDMPTKTSVFRWLNADKAFSDHYARAREAQADTMADDILDIADDGRGDKYIDGDGNEGGGAHGKGHGRAKGGEARERECPKRRRYPTGG